jgi:hypothetical protein
MAAGSSPPSEQPKPIAVLFCLVLAEEDALCVCVCKFGVTCLCGRLSGVRSDEEQETAQGVGKRGATAFQCLGVAAGADQRMHTRSGLVKHAAMFRVGSSARHQGLNRRGRGSPERKNGGAEAGRGRLLRLLHDAVHHKPAATTAGCQSQRTCSMLAQCLSRGMQAAGGWRAGWARAHPGSPAHRLVLLRGRQGLRLT